MPTVTPSLNLPQPATSSASTFPSTPASTSAAAAKPALPASASMPSTTVTLSPQGMSALAASGHPPSSGGGTSGSAAPVAAPASHDDSIYDSLKNGISSAVADIGGAIEGGAEAVVHGVEATVSTANDIAKGILELPFAAVAKVADAFGAVIDEL